MIKDDKLRLCWCEQSGIIDEDRKTLLMALRDNAIDYFRYNWKYGKADPYANVHASGRLSWSMGRSLLYQQAQQKNYDYYIFSDDDVDFSGDPGTSLSLIRNFLSNYQPLTACLGSNNWQDYLRRKIPKFLRAKIHSYFLADLQLQIFSSFVAKETFPCIFDGGWKTLWYPNVAVGLYAPSLQLQFNEVTIINRRGNLSTYYGGIEHQKLHQTIDRATFNQMTPKWFRIVIRRFGAKKVAIFINACLSVRKIGRKKEFSAKSEALILRYLKAARNNVDIAPSISNKT